MLQLVSELKTYAEKALLSGPWSVTHKPDSSVAISGDKHDYFHRSPYYWPKNPRDAMDPNRKWVRRDGKRYPGTGLHEAGSENFDRTRLKDMQYNTTILGLAYYITREAQYAEVAARNIRTWFLDSETRMNPHMRYAQVVNGHNNNTGISFGIIEMKDLYFMLDAIRIIEKDNFLTKDEQVELRSWFQEYLAWLETSEIGQEEYSQKNNHGLYFDIQALAIASFINDTAKMIWYAERSTPRLLSHIKKDGSMPQELQRPTCEHYQMFTLQGWSVLSRMANTVNRNRWKVQRTLPTQSTKRDLHGQQHISESLSVLCQAAKYTIPMFGRSQKCQRSIEFREDITRWWPLYLDAIYECPELIKSSVGELPITWFPKDARHPPPLNAYEMPSLYNPHDGIAPFWNLGLSYPVDSKVSLENAEVSPSIKM
jgi:Alginate lyase